MCWMAGCPVSITEKSFQRDDKLQVGGWGDTYRTYIQFDLTGLPARVSSARLKLHAFAKGDGSTLTAFDVWNPGSDWATSSLTTSMTWDTQPTGNTLVTTVSPGANGSFWDIPITSLYNAWRAGTSTNRGLMLSPKGINNNFDLWRSSRYSGDGQRPILEFTFTPPVAVPEFKIPLPRNLSWLVTTEVGGYDCAGTFDSAHSGSNYFSIDFSWRNKNSAGAQVYGSPDAGTEIPVTASAGGIVADVITSSGHANFANNGYFVAISHDPSGSLGTGFSTRYLHLKAAPIVRVGQTVTQGQTLGYMGNTGASIGPHLHFGMRYKNNGVSTTNPMYAVMNGWLLKSFQTECSGASPIRYYLSS